MLHSKKAHSSRIIHHDGKAVRVKRSGVKKFLRSDFYATSVSSSWLRLIVTIIILYTLLNSIFAGLYLLEDGAIENAKSGSFADAFFFSVQTLATIGYGKMAPATNFANILVTVEALTGLAGLAVATGVIYSKISLPSARILFGNRAIFSLHKNVNCLSFRLGNLRNNPIADPLIKAVLIIDEELADGSIRRAFHDLVLIRNNVPLLMPSWTLRHQIIESSPLFGMTKEEMRKKNIEVIVSLVGFDETISQTVHAHHSYIADEIEHGKNFVDIISFDKRGRAHVDYKKFHDFI
ncbi:MAG: ATP-sensitive inward rectifier potassium channel 10 [Proteobacteria bacterium]|nr:ATP-sensitive inward rectifier potassium channel 10 [Pseudomonadota bacterium]